MNAVRAQPNVNPDKCLDSEKIKIGYWSIRGLAAALRMVCEYAEADWESVTYDLHKTEDGKWDASCWFKEADAKPRLLGLNGLTNLPYVEHKGVVVTQTNACLTYLGRQFDLNGSTETEVQRNEQCLCELMDMRNNAIKLFYSPSFEADVDAYVTAASGVRKALGKLEGWLAGAKTSFLSADRPLTADFHFFEMLLQHTELANRRGVTTLLDDTPLVQAYFQRMQQLPAMEKYLASDVAKLPVNNKMSGFL